MPRPAVDNARIAQIQETLESLTTLQGDLQKLVNSQHEVLRERLDTLLAHIGGQLKGAEVDACLNDSEEVELAHIGGQLKSSEELDVDAFLNESEEVELCPVDTHPSDSLAPSPKSVRMDPSVTDPQDQQSRRLSLCSMQPLQVPAGPTISVATTCTYPTLRPGGRGGPRYWAIKLARHPWFDVFVGILIMLNFMWTFAELEWKGYDNAYRLELRSNNRDWKGARRTFRIVEMCFVAVFNVEMLFRVFCFRRKFFRDPFNLCDFLVVLLTTVESYIFHPMMGEEGTATSTKILALSRLVRVVRTVRLFRFLRILRLMGMFRSLRVLVRTLMTSMDSLFWSMVVVGFIIVSAAMLMVQLVSDVIADETQTSTLREWCYKYYGTMFRASYTMFEATFSGAWASRLSRPLVEEAESAFSIFWVFYSAVVNFAVMRVIAALFLKQTMDVARVDAERVNLLKMKEKEKIIATLREVFKLGDKEADGYLQRWEFEQMMEDEKILSLFQGIELEPPELYMLFDLLAEDDGAADQDEFLIVAMKLKNSVRTVDMIQVLHEQMMIRRSIEVVKDGLERMDDVLHPTSPWKAQRDLVFKNKAKSKGEDL